MKSRTSLDGEICIVDCKPTKNLKINPQILLAIQIFFKNDWDLCVNKRVKQAEIKNIW